MSLMTPGTARTLAACALIAAAGAVAAGCGGDDGPSAPAPATDAAQATARNASAADGEFPSSRACPEENPSWRWRGVVSHSIAVPVKMWVGTYTCDDWSGRSTPGAALNDRWMGDAIRVTLEPRMYRNRYFTMQFDNPDKRPHDPSDFGVVRMSISEKQDGDHWVTPAQGTSTYTWRYTRLQRAQACEGKVFKLNPTTLPASDPNNFSSSYDWLQIVSVDGHIALLTRANCEWE